MICGYDTIDAKPGERVEVAATRAHGGRIRYFIHNCRVYEVSAGGAWSDTGERLVVLHAMCGFCGADLGDADGLDKFRRCPKCAAKAVKP